MADHDHPGWGYIRKVQGHVQRFTEELLNENHKLRLLATGWQNDNRRLQSQVAMLHEAHDRGEQEQIILQKQLAEIESENRRYTKEYVEVEQQNSNLAHLYVASYRLHGSLDRQEVLRTIQEIIANLVGSEEIAIFEVDPATPVLRLVASTGIDANRYREIRVGAGAIGRVAQTGESLMAGSESPGASSNGDGPITACIPLKIDGRVTGVIAMFRLLQQKTNGLEPIDHELFDLLATHAASALYCSNLHSASVGGAARAA